MNPRGGSEILYGNLQKYVDRSYLNKINILFSVCDSGKLHSTLPNVLWQHLNTNEEAVYGLRDNNFLNKIDKFVFVSEWQMNKFVDVYTVPIEKSIVLRNAIDPIEFIEKPKSNKLKFIYTSTPWRGLDILLDSFKLLNRDDIELDVYSSTVIYGSHFMVNKFNWLFDLCRNTKNVNYKGYVTNKAIRKAVQSSHIFSYPSIFEETSCLSAIEAGSAGCKLVLTDFGALKETCGKYANYISFHENRENLVEEYSKLLNYEIDNYWDNYNMLEEQSQYFNNRYSWQLRKNEWINLIDNI